MYNTKTDFGKHLKQLRQRCELTQQALAEKADISISFLGAIERGKKSPTIDVLQKLATALNITLGELVSFHNASAQENATEKEQLNCLLAEYADKIRSIYEK